VSVPFLDLKAQCECLREEIEVAFWQVLNRTAFAGSPFVAQFEKEFAAFCQCPHVLDTPRRGAIRPTHTLRALRNKLRPLTVFSSSFASS